MQDLLTAYSDDRMGTHSRYEVDPEPRPDLICNGVTAAIVYVPNRRVRAHGLVHGLSDGLVLLGREGRRASVQDLRRVHVQVCMRRDSRRTDGVCTMRVYYYATTPETVQASAYLGVHLTAGKPGTVLLENRNILGHGGSNTDRYVTPTEADALTAIEDVLRTGQHAFVQNRIDTRVVEKLVETRRELLRRG